MFINGVIDRNAAQNLIQTTFARLHVLVLQQAAQLRHMADLACLLVARLACHVSELEYCVLSLTEVWRSAARTAHGVFTDQLPIYHKSVSTAHMLSSFV